MPNYDIRYLDEDGSLLTELAARLANDTQAKVLAHALKEKGMRRLEVWDGESLVYQRPQRAEDSPAFSRNILSFPAEPCAAG